ncbi:unannotated protein [freshwater metagenome]|uniref:Unannotated protein n=1 Tax=freshwater metagenome TaxID=449393 RepID=A0A6J6Y893_9ZZZZ
MDTVELPALLRMVIVAFLSCEGVVVVGLNTMLTSQPAPTATGLPAQVLVTAN